MAAAAIPFLVVGTLFQAKAAYDAGKHNAEIGRQQARIARQSAIANAKQQARENYLRLGDMRAAIGASGGTGGSFLDVLADSAAQMELQRQNVLYSGMVKASLLESGASMSEAGAFSAGVGGVLSASGALIGGRTGGVRREGTSLNGLN